MRQQNGVVRDILSGMSARVLMLPVAGIAAILTTRLVNITLGPQTFAVYSLVAGLPLLFPASDLGLGAPITNAASTVETEPARFYAVLHRSLLIAFAVAFAIATASVFLGTSGLWTRLLGLSDPGLNTPISLAITIFGFSVPGGLGAKVLIGIGRYALGVVIQGMTPVLSLVSVGTALGLGAQTSAVVSVSSFGLFFANWFGFLMAVILMPTRPAGYHPNLHHGVMDEVIRTAMPMIAMTSAGAAVYQSGRFVLSHVSTLQQVAVYAALWTFFQPLMSVVVTAGLTLWPRFAAARSAGRTVKREFRVATLTSTAIGLGAGVGLTALGPLAVRIATAGNVEVDHFQCAILGATITALATMLPAGMMLTFPRGLWIQAGAASIAAFVVVAVGALGASSLGATASFIGLFAAVAFAEAIPLIATAMFYIRQQSHA